MMIYVDQDQTISKPKAQFSEIGYFRKQNLSINIKRFWLRINFNMLINCLHKKCTKKGKKENKQLLNSKTDLSNKKPSLLKQIR